MQCLHTILGGPKSTLNDDNSATYLNCFVYTGPKLQQLQLSHSSGRGSGCRSNLPC